MFEKSKGRDRPQVWVLIDVSNAAVGCSMLGDGEDIEGKVCCECIGFPPEVDCFIKRLILDNRTVRLRVFSHPALVGWTIQAGAFERLLFRRCTGPTV